MSAKKRGLGRGLDALLATSQREPSAESTELPEDKGELQKLPIEFLKPGKYHQMNHYQFYE